MSAVKATSGGGSGPPKGSELAAKRSFQDGFKDYFESLRYEWRKITWPERKQWKDSTIVVFVFTIFLMFFAFSFINIGETLRINVESGQYLSRA